MMHPHDILVETAKRWYEDQRSGPLEDLMYTWDELPDRARLDILASSIHLKKIIRVNLFRRNYTTEELVDHLNEQNEKEKD